MAPGANLMEEAEFNLSFPSAMSIDVYPRKVGAETTGSSMHLDQTYFITFGGISLSGTSGSRLFEIGASHGVT